MTHSSEHSSIRPSVRLRTRGSISLAVAVVLFASLALLVLSAADAPPAHASGTGFSTTQVPSAYCKDGKISPVVRIVGPSEAIAKYRWRVYQATGYNSWTLVYDTTWSASFKLDSRGERKIYPNVSVRQGYYRVFAQAKVLNPIEGYWHTDFNWTEASQYFFYFPNSNGQWAYTANTGWCYHY